MKVVINKTHYKGQLLDGIDYVLVAETIEDAIILNLIQNNPKLAKFYSSKTLCWTYNPKEK